MIIALQPFFWIIILHTAEIEFLMHLINQLEFVLCEIKQSLDKLLSNIMIDSINIKDFDFLQTYWPPIMQIFKWLVFKWVKIGKWIW